MKNRMIMAASLIVATLSWLAVAQQQPASKTGSKDLCVKPAAGPIGVTTSPARAGASESVSLPVARVGHPAPDFEANAFIDGGFRPVKLSDYKGKWVVLCFYPGDFTFV